jgi:hypothetical protein
MAEGTGNLLRTFYLLKVTYPLIILFLSNLFNLVEELSYSKLEFVQLIFSSDLLVVVGMLSDLDVKVDTLEGSRSNNQ